MADWQIQCENLSQRGKELIFSDKLADCAFIVGSGENAITIKCHKFFLAIASPVFETMFYGSIPENDGPVPILDLQPQTFKGVLGYIYTDSATIDSCDEACKLYYAAKKYMLPFLMTRCIDYLVANVEVVNVCSAYEFAKLFEVTSLIEHCLNIFQQQTDKVLADSSFVECQIETVITIFKQRILNVTELELYDAAVKYSGTIDTNKKSEEKYKIDLSNITHSADMLSTETASNVLSSEFTIKDAIRNIRFLTFTTEQFADGPALSNLLTKNEALSIMIKIASPDSQQPMPEGFIDFKNIERVKHNGRYVYTRS